MAILAMASASTEKSGTANLDAAIQQASKDINDTLPAGTKVALLNFTSGSDVLSDYIIEEMSIALVKGRKLTVVDRKEIDLIRGEMNFQMSGEVSDESAQEIGKLLGAQSIVSGSLINMGANHRFRTKVINVNSAAIETSASISVADDPQIQFLLSQGKGAAPRTAQSGGGTQAVPAQAGTSNQAQPATPALVAYKVGDTGPAGGLIFYDKGNNSSGWRYLEVAPEAAEFQAIWSVHSTKVDNTQEGIGYGKRNTQLIVETFSKTSGEWDTAAQKADDFVFNGFDDWFLPSRAELDQMYGSLKRRILGDFKDEWYWSSTEEVGWTTGAWGAYCQNFKDGKMDYGSKMDKKYYVRPIRQVAGPAR
jgi:TolB-like protein